MMCFVQTVDRTNEHHLVNDLDTGRRYVWHCVLVCCLYVLSAARSISLTTAAAAATAETVRNGLTTNRAHYCVRQPAAMRRRRTTASRVNWIHTT